MSSHRWRLKDGVWAMIHRCPQTKGATVIPADLAATIDFWDARALLPIGEVDEYGADQQVEFLRHLNGKLTSVDQEAETAWGESTPA